MSLELRIKEVFALALETWFLTMHFKNHQQINMVDLKYVNQMSLWLSTMPYSMVAW